VARKRGNGEGGITRHKKSGLYMARYTVDTPTGKKRKTVYGRTREEAHEKLIEALSNRNKGLVFEGDNQTLGTYLADWLRDIEGTIKQRTLENYEYVVRKHIVPELGEVKLKALKPDRVRRLYREKIDAGLSNRTVQLIHTVLRKALQQAVSDEILPRNVCQAVKAPRRVKKEIPPLHPEEVRTLLRAACGDRFEALYVVAVTAGLRRGELLGLRWADLDLERGTLQVRRQLTRTKAGLSFTSPKRGKTRSVRLTQSAIKALRSHRKRQLEEKLRLAGLWQDFGLVFPSRAGTPMDADNLVQRSFEPLLKRAELPRVRFHDLRHTFATVLLSGGTHPKVVQEMLGHANISQTMDTYSHVLPDMQDGAISAMESALR
jgi:integrase